MKTLNLQQAAELLHIHPVTLQSKAKAGDIPGAKIGKCWVFVDVDLIKFIRSQYDRRTLQGEQEISLCHSLNVKTRPSGGSRSPSTDELYRKALAPPTKPKRKNSMTG
ncbi:helix-turn-helix domain-containing protein [Methylomarinum vadi]|uniref:helix-turn-helix domain-containing protein n=1 Tax=Methylomarinum vadi TaxID=438855 RepID=UPI000A0717B6